MCTCDTKSDGGDIHKMIAWLALFVSIATFHSTLQARTCEARRSHANETIELAITTKHLAQSKIGRPMRCYAPTGAPFLEPPQNPDLTENVNEWNKNFVLLREKKDLLIAKVATLGETKLKSTLDMYIKALDEFVADCRPEIFDQLWDTLSIQSCELIQKIGENINQCFGLQNAALDCQSTATRSYGTLQPS